MHSGDVASPPNMSNRDIAVTSINIPADLRLSWVKEFCRMRIKRVADKTV